MKINCIFCEISDMKIEGKIDSILRSYLVQKKALKILYLKY